MFPRSRIGWQTLIGIIAIGAGLADCQGQAPPTGGGELREQQLAEAKRINEEVVSLYDVKKFTEAIPVAEKHTALMLELFGPDHPKHLMSLDNLALVCQAAGQDDRARPLFEKVSTARRQRCELLLKQFHELALPGDEHSNDQRLMLISEVEDTEAELLLSAPVASDQDRTIQERAHERFFVVPPPLGGIRYDDVAERQQAIEATQAVLREQTRTLGEASPTVDWTRALLSLLLCEAGNPDAAKEIVRESQAAWVSKFGEQSLRANWLSSYLGEILWQDDPDAYWIWELHRWEKIATASREQNDNAQEILALGTVIRIQRDELLWDSGLNDATRLAELHELSGDLRAAAHWYRQFAASVTSRSSASHESVLAIVEAERLDALSGLDTDRQLELRAGLEQLSGARKALHGGSRQDALDKSREAFVILERLVGKDHILSISAELTLGSALLRLRKIDEATEVLNSAEKKLEWRGPFSQSSIAGGMLGDLGDCLLRTDPVRAKELHQRAVRQLATAQVLWSDDDLHWREICSRHALAEMAWSRGELQEAWEQLAEVLSRCHIHRERTLGDLPEVGQLVALRRYQDAIDDYLSVSTSLERDVLEEYDVVVGWKGTSLRRLGRWRSSSTGRASTDPRVTKAHLEILNTVRQLAAWRLTPDTAQNPERETQSSSLRQHLSEWETWLAGISSVHMNVIQSNLQLGDGELAQTAGEIVNWSERNPEIALVDYFDYEHSTPPAAPDQVWLRERRLLCYVLRGGRIQRIKLGNSVGIRELVDAWRGQLQGLPVDQERNDPEQQLRERIWEPIDTAVGDAGLIVVSPIGALTQIPFVALPGRQPGTFLIEDHTITYVSAMQLMQNHFVESFDDPETPNLACLGGVDFGTGDGRFGSLQGTLKEARQVEKIYRTTFPNGESVVLEGAAATKTALFEASPKAQYLLLATHGFSVEDTTQTLTDSDGRVSLKGQESPAKSATAFPDLTSGLILARGNLMTRDSIEQNWLTAAEAGYLPLDHCRLVVLSACESGIGQLAGYEGMQSLQRALQVAGAEATISSLWKVPDEATQLLMIRFFANHWKRSMGKAEALREAQLWLMRGEYRTSPETRGAGIEGPAIRSGPLPAIYWAGFTLNGNWE